MRELAAGAADLDAIHRVVSGEVRALVHVNRAADIRTLLELSADWAQPPVIVGGAEAWAVAALLAERGATVVLNPLMNLPSSFDMLGARDDNAALLVAAGVPVAFASSDTHNARTVRQLAGNAVRAGLPYQAAIAGLTVEAAATAGVDDRFGRLQVGHVADLVLWTGDPLEFSSGVHAMWIQGEQQSLTHRQQALFERYRP
jgi:imidazolonepropionase-like amidohydrolase